MSNIQKQSRRVRMLLQSLFVLTPIMVCYFWLTVETPYDFISSTGIFYLTYDIGNYTMLPLTMTTRIVTAFTSLLMSSILMYALMVLIRLFRNYERGEIFSLENAMSYQKLGYSLFYWVLGSVIYGSLMSVILSFNNPPGERIFEISFVGMDFLTLILGIIILIISWVMKEGYILADEHSQTI
ncbi:DUF2975 domain-containing protein [Vibrio sp. 10N.222.51.C8]|uniref:DUF2975 domain-containing protein n=1 Tax=Vibrio TaxID=662 RepID=UPI000C81DB6A|nr:MULTISPECIES: DUF2975 domain-containing protein [Vibrio]PMN96694.1 DUF2975 domain-containing protein [Vibrio splendidus]PMO08492.1 DUF2975 domain-containing protein [Vibrio sp. 10N.222.55.C12]PMO14025.1 DUF2975 domain-containing protein [Vibrio sp. 10N.222.54.F10]PMO18969.1 DUF2975 domain-containing protein [Vibrio sp. 10N.222.54.B6]PTO83605.1 DUF2975 domain-containing protein [Vibrio splendidus]